MMSEAKSNGLEEMIQREIKKSGFSSKDFGIWIQGEEDSISLNGDRLFTPASLSKIPTALATLVTFPMNHHFFTWVKAVGEIRSGVLKGDLYLQGGGDPSFVSESMWLLVNKLKREGLKSIEGNLYYDDSFFDQDYFPESRQKKRVDRAYDAPVSALSFNWNSITVHIRPSQVGKAPHVFLEPEVPYVTVINNARTIVGKKSKTKLSVRRVSKGDGKERIYVSGTIPTSKKEKTFYKSVSDGSRWTAESFKAFLLKEGITISGSLAPKVTPKKARVLVEHESWEMSRIVSALSKYSNNFIAEMLTKHIGKKVSQQGSLKAGLKQIRSFLNSHGWSSSGYSFTNPSGFTYDNKMKPSDLGELLLSVKSMFKLYPEFISALPISGVDGTLKDRMRPAAEHIRAKTGYLSGVVGLGGYVQGSAGSKGVFVMIYNGPTKNDWGVKKFFDRLAKKISDTLK